ncbi:MAG: DNA-binding GntR family transcriptional regulator [Planctomycetota bacterium]|jgi:DNA-binding GntR family transcriptional regulator
MTLTDDITRDLTQRIRAQRAKPEQLTLAALANEYGVSATPIRQALARLMASGLVERLANGRLANGRLSLGQLSPGRRAPKRGHGRPTRLPQPTTMESTSLTETVEREVLRRSLRGEHEFLREEAFAERMGVGRTQLRSVLHTLAGAGVVEHVKRRGWRARPFQREDMLAFLDVRATLEVQALDLAKAHIRDADVARFLLGNSDDAVASGTIDNDLHGYFVEKANNHYLAAFFASHGRYYSRLFDFAAVDANRLEEMAGQHSEILRHTRAKHWARARTTLRHHIHSQEPVLSAAIDRLTCHLELNS